ncbi:hypothetical protein ACFPOE_02255 [Caenimonas terrae]|uniref:Lipoprotein n=1 Tax=Caenimonas terrae TaxID=696074 RepID=A0ABW0NB14_9BURK
MPCIFELTPVLFALTLSGLLAGCDKSGGPQSAAVVAPGPAGAVVANDCRSPNAQTTQRGCRPATRLMGSL